MKCPECKGQGEITAFGCPGFTPIRIPCELCKKTGEITGEQAEWVKIGETMRQDRISRGYTLRKEAERRGIDAIKLSYMERGIFRPIK